MSDHVQRARGTLQRPLDESEVRLVDAEARAERMAEELDSISLRFEPRSATRRQLASLAAQLRGGSDAA